MQDNILDKFLRRIGDNPQFLNHLINQRGDRSVSAEQLGITLDQLNRLALCRPPKSWDDLVQIAAAIPCDVFKLNKWLGVVKVRKPRGWSLMEPCWDYATCPRCGSAVHTFYTGKDDPDRPYTYYKHLCGECGEKWASTKIWD